MPSLARAHQSSIVYSEIVVRGRNVEYTFQVADTELGPALGLGERAVGRDDVKPRQSAFLAYLTERVKVTNAGYPCEPQPRGVELADKADGFFALATIDYECKRTAADVSVDYNLFFELDPRHQGFARVTLPGRSPNEHVFKESSRTLRLEQTVTLFDHVRDYLLLGIEHIFTGYDHIAFLFGLLVVAGFSSLRGGLRYVLGIVTAFTVAHSLTLIASGLDWVRLPPIVVEPAIALSITYVAIENLSTPTPRFRWLLTFGFGLVHGFGFASVLREIGLPPRGLVLSLLSFNVGVEIGQLAVVALAAPALYLLAKGALKSRELFVLALISAAAFLLLRRFHLPTAQLAVVVIGVPAILALAVPRVGYDRAVRIGGSSLLAALAIFWFFERVLAKTLLGGALG
ncbi:MAG TPA: HupE/UreJ family protein [Polyangia bacterium]|nr:HupE/UreJ family protein [Polyangia bacterium]